MDITGNTVFIPGATSGIGLALALALRERGNTVIVGGRRTELLERIAVEHPVSRPSGSTPPTRAASRKRPRTSSRASRR